MSDARTIEVRGHHIPKLGFGTWQLRGETCVAAVRHALAVGYRHLDTAQAYANEEQVGRALADSGVDRDDVWVTTKVRRNNARPDDVRRSTEDSLQRLGLDHVDLLLLHWPNEDVPLEATLGAMDELRERGLTATIGVSNFPSELMKQAIDVAPIVTDQVEYHPFLDQSEVLDVVEAHGLSLTAYSPLAQGDVLNDDVLAEIGEAHGATGAQVALRWLLDQERVIAIPRSSSEDHITANIEAFDLELSDDERARIDALAGDRRLVDPGFAPDWDR